MDKNVGSAIISHNLYNQLALNSLIYNDVYIELEDNPLILKAQNLSVPENAQFFSCDFESLYTNILLDSLLNVICEYMKPFLTS